MKRLHPGPDLNIQPVLHGRDRTGIFVVVRAVRIVWLISFFPGKIPIIVEMGVSHHATLNPPEVDFATLSFEP